MMRWGGLLGVLVTMLAVGSSAPAAEYQGPDRGRPVMFVANAEGGTVSIVDARSFKLLREINVISDGDPLANPTTAALVAAVGPNYAQDQDLSRDGRTLFVSRGYRGDVAAFDVRSGRLSWKAPIPGIRSDHMAISPDGRVLAVSALSANEVIEIDTRTGAVLRRAPTGQWPHDNHFSADGRRLYNGSIGTIVAPPEMRGAMSPPPYQLTVIDTSDFSVERTFTFDRGIRPFVITHDERRMFAQLSELSGVVEIDLATGEIVRRLELPVDPGVTRDDYDFEAPHHGLAISSDEKTLCAAGRISDYAALVSTRTLKAEALVELGDGPGWAATDPLGKHCFVTNTRDDTLSAVSYAKRREVKRIRVGDGPKQLEAALLPEAVLCSSTSVPGCSGRMRAVASCTSGGRVRLRVEGDLDAVMRVMFRADGKQVATDDAAPYSRTVSSKLAQTIAGKRIEARIQTSARTVKRTVRAPRCGRT